MTDSTDVATVRIELLHVPDCPLLDRLRNTLQDCLLDSDIHAKIDELEGDYPSPTLLINGIDATTGKPPTDRPCCRLDLPTGRQILTALNHSTRA